MIDSDPTHSLPKLPDGYSVRPPARDEASALAELLRACEIETSGASNMTLNDFLGDWEGTDLQSDAIVVVGPDGSPAAYADLDERGNVVYFTFGCVHPGQIGNGLGSFLVAWGEQRARAGSMAAPDGASIVTRHYINECNQRARALLVAKGYEPIRMTYTMQIDLNGTPLATLPPDGITLRTYVPGQDDQAAYEAYEDAFADMWQRPRGTFEQFISKTRRPYFDPAHWYLAMDGDQIAGTLFADDIDGKGWIEIVGVRRPWRSRGLALAMLDRAFANFYQRGVTHIGLSVDAQSPTGALRLYERAGMRLDESYLLFERELRPGFSVTTGSGST